jgi:hypothetical protein
MFGISEIFIAVEIQKLFRALELKLLHEVHKVLNFYYDSNSFKNCTASTPTLRSGHKIILQKKHSKQIIT